MYKVLPLWQRQFLWNKVTVLKRYRISLVNKFIHLYKSIVIRIVENVNYSMYPFQHPVAMAPFFKPVLYFYRQPYIMFWNRTNKTLVVHYDYDIITLHEQSICIDSLCLNPRLLNIVKQEF